MKRILSLILVSIMLLLVLISCGNEVDTDTETDTDSQIIDTSTDNQQKNIETITDFPALAVMQENAEKIKITYYVKGEYKKLTVTNEQDISSIMKSLLECEIKEVGKEIPPGSGYFRLDITSSGKEFIVSQCMLYSGSYYEIRGDIDEVLENLVFPPNEYIANGCQNSLNTTRIDMHKYYEPISLGGYIGTSVPSEENNGHDFEEGLYYEVIGDYEKALTLFTDTSALDEKLFEDYFIFAMGIHIATGLPYDIYGFYNLYFDGYLDVAKISLDGKDGFNVTEACSVHSFYIKVPKTDSYRYTWLEKNTGKIDWDFNTDEYYDMWSRFEVTEPIPVSEGTSWVLSSREQVAEFAEYYGIKLSLWDQLVIDNDSYIVVVCMKNWCYGCFVGFKDFHSDGENVYLTYEKNSCSANHEDNELSLMYFTVSKSNIATAISQNPTVNVLVEENAKKHIN